MWTFSLLLAGDWIGLLIAVHSLMAGLNEAGCFEKPIYSLGKDDLCFSSIPSRLNALFYETDLFEDRDQTDMYRLIILSKIGEYSHSKLHQIQVFLSLIISVQPLHFSSSPHSSPPTGFHCVALVVSKSEISLTCFWVLGLKACAIIPDSSSMLKWIIYIKYLLTHCLKNTIMY